MGDFFALVRSRVIKLVKEVAAPTTNDFSHTYTHCHKQYVQMLQVYSKSYYCVSICCFVYFELLFVCLFVLNCCLFGNVVLFICFELLFCLFVLNCLFCLF